MLQAEGNSSVECKNKLQQNTANHNECKRANTTNNDNNIFKSQET